MFRAHIKTFQSQGLISELKDIQRNEYKDSDLNRSSTIL